LPSVELPAERDRVLREYEQSYGRDGALTCFIGAFSEGEGQPDGGTFILALRQGREDA
jgi:hypothetical protein